VFSQFTKFLDVIQCHLVKKGFTFVRLDGSMTVAKRDIALNTFSTSPTHTIMLASLAVCSVGVIFPWVLLMVVESCGGESGYFGR
jgi:SWI/SNF-related matrix-associated actin-dependent regulator of chromatin subfamily A3